MGSNRSDDAAPQSIEPKRKGRDLKKRERKSRVTLPGQGTKIVSIIYIRQRPCLGGEGLGVGSTGGKRPRKRGGFEKDLRVNNAETEKSTKLAVRISQEGEVADLGHVGEGNFNITC